MDGDGEPLELEVAVPAPTDAPPDEGVRRDSLPAGRYVTKRIYVEGKQSTTGQSQVEVDVDLTKHLKLQTRLGNGTAVPFAAVIAGCGLGAFTMSKSLPRAGDRPLQRQSA